MNELILERLSVIEKLIQASQSPRLSKKEACKFLKIGRDKFDQELGMRHIKQHVDRWGQKYYLKDELLNYLKH